MAGSRRGNRGFGIALDQDFITPESSSDCLHPTQKYGKILRFLAHVLYRTASISGSEHTGGQPRYQSWIFEVKEKHKIKAAYRYPLFPFLCAVLPTSLAISTSTATQDGYDNYQKQARVYDRPHEDNHRRNDNEEWTYRQYLGRQCQHDREFSKLNRNLPILV